MQKQSPRSSWMRSTPMTRAVSARSTPRRLHRGSGRREGGGQGVDHRVRDYAGDREPLLLAAGEAVPALADDGVVAVRERRDELVQMRRPRCCFDLFLARVG